MTNSTITTTAISKEGIELNIIFFLAITIIILAYLLIKVWLLEEKIEKMEIYIKYYFDLRSDITMLQARSDIQYKQIELLWEEIDGLQSLLNN